MDRIKRSRSAGRILETATLLFFQRSYTDVTIREVAQESGVDEATVYRLFGSKDGLAAGCWSRFVGDLRTALEADLAETVGQPIAIITSHLYRTAAVAVDNRALTNAMLFAVQAATIRHGSEAVPKDPRAFVPLPRLLVEPIRIGQAMGSIRSDKTAYELAAFLTNSLLVRIMTRPEHSAENVVEFILDLILPGMKPPGRELAE